MGPYIFVLLLKAYGIGYGTATMQEFPNRASCERFQAAIIERIGTWKINDSFCMPKDRPTP